MSSTDYTPVTTDAFYVPDDSKSGFDSIFDGMSHALTEYNRFSKLNEEEAKADAKEKLKMKRDEIRFQREGKRFDMEEERHTMSKEKTLIDRFDKNIGKLEDKRDKNIKEKTADAEKLHKIEMDSLEKAQATAKAEELKRVKEKAEKTKKATIVREKIETRINTLKDKKFDLIAKQYEFNQKQGLGIEKEEVSTVNPAIEQVQKEIDQLRGTLQQIRTISEGADDDNKDVKFENPTPPPQQTLPPQQPDVAGSGVSTGANIALNGTPTVGSKVLKHFDPKSPIEPVKGLDPTMQGGKVMDSPEAIAEFSKALKVIEEKYPHIDPVDRAEYAEAYIEMQEEQKLEFAKKKKILDDEVKKKKRTKARGEVKVKTSEDKIKKEISNRQVPDRGQQAKDYLGVAGRTFGEVWDSATGFVENKIKNNTGLKLAKASLIGGKILYNEMNYPSRALHQIDEYKNLKRSEQADIKKKYRAKFDALKTEEDKRFFRGIADVVEEAYSGYILYDWQRKKFAVTLEKAKKAVKKFPDMFDEYTIKLVEKAKVPVTYDEYMAKKKKSKPKKNGYVPLQAMPDMIKPSYRNDGRNLNEA